MGLLDQFSGMSDDQGMGLLSAGLGMMAASGPSRTPTNFGQVGLAGMQNYQGSIDAARKRKQDEDQLRQMAQLRGLQIQEAQGGLADHDRKRTQEDALRSFYLNQRTGAGGAPSDPMAQLQASMGGDLSPTIANANKLAQLQQQPAPPGSAQGTGDPFSQRMALAQQLRGQGFHVEADAQEAAALKFKQKFSTTPQQMLDANGKLRNYQLSEDGGARDLGLGVRPDMVQTSLGGTTRWDDKNALVPGQTFAHTQSPDSLASNALSRERLNFDKSQAEAPESAFSPGAITNAAGRYNLDGTLPPMGMGKSGSAGRAAILNEAATLAAGVDGTEQRRLQLATKGETLARNASLIAYSARGKEGQAIQATNTGLNHLDTVEQLAMAQKNGNIPLFNTIANRFAKETGQPAPTNLAAAITMVAPEVSKAVIGASGGQEERATFAKNFNPSGSPQQALEGIGVIKELMGGRLTEAQRTYERTLGKQDFRETMLSPAAQRVLDKAHGGQPAQASAASAKTATLADIAATARASGKTTAEVTAAMRKAGYTIGGQ